MTYGAEGEAVLMKSASAVILIACLSLCFTGNAFPANDAVRVSSKNEGSIYSYSENNIPEVFFFPKDRARWDGSKVTMREWYMLTDLQKEKFVSEYLRELNKDYQGAMETLGLDYLKALNLFSYYSNDKTLNEPSTKFIDLLIKGQNKGE